MIERKHQRQAIVRASDIARGDVADRVTVADVTPGGGKSRMAALFAAQLLGKTVDRVCWVVPRTSLRQQAEAGFLEATGLHVRAAANEPPLVRDGAVGYVTTYQAIDANPALHEHEFRRGRYLLILDEPHHLADEDAGSWKASIAPLVASAAHVLMMTGTIERNDGLRIPFMPYEERDGRHFPLKHIAYSMTDALAEDALVRAVFRFCDGWASYIAGAGEVRERLSEASTDDGRTLRAALSQPNYWQPAIDQCLSDWTVYRASFPGAKAIVVCASQQMAKAATAYIKATCRGVQVALAISDEEDSQRTLRQFRSGKRGDVLVTVGMAYEGLDVPALTHMACLTQYRSEGWLRQCFARVTRVCGDDPRDARDQSARIWIPDDPTMQDVVRLYEQEQARGIVERERREAAAGAERQVSAFVPLDAALDRVTVAIGGERMTDDDSARVERMRAVLDVPEEKLAALLRIAREPVNTVPAATPQETLSEQEARLRGVAEQLARSVDRDRYECRWGTANKLVIKRFNKSREAMGVSELRRAVDYLANMLGGAESAAS
jgi:superfamily II DNA or RNA helicase